MMPKYHEPLFYNVIIEDGELMLYDKEGQRVKGITSISVKDTVNDFIECTVTLLVNLPDSKQEIIDRSSKSEV